MIKKYFIGALISSLIFSACAPSSFSGSSSTSWAKLIFAPSLNDNNNACDLGTNSNTSQEIGQISIRAAQGLITFQSALGWVYDYCGYVARVPATKPKDIGGSSTFFVTDSATSLDKVNVKIVLEDVNSKEIANLEPKSKNKLEDGRYAFSFYDTSPSKEAVQILEQTVAFTFRVSRDGKLENYRFTQQQYSALGNKVVR